MRLMAIFSVLSLTAATGCIVGTNGNCSDIAVAGVTVIVTDSASGARLCGGTVQLTDASGYKELVSPSGSPTTCVYSGAFERPGTYTVSVFVQGYSADLQNNVVVSAGNCHVRTTTVQSSLHP